MIEETQITSKTIFRHVLFWIAYILYMALHEAWMDKDQLTFSLAPQFLTDIPVSIVLTYINLYLLMPAFYYPKRYVNYVITLCALLSAGGLLDRYFTYLVWVPWDKIHEPAAYQTENKNFFIWVRILKNAVETYPLVAVTMLIKLMRNAHQQEKYLREIEHKKHTAEMGLLKAQLNPHFFFNTLNSLYALTLKGSEMASGVVLRLSELMQYMLYDSNHNQVGLSEEIKHLENYINIEQMRFADRLDVSFKYSGEIDGKTIAPLLLLPFVENAFKHGIENDFNRITIRLKVEGTQLSFKMENSCQLTDQTKGNGLGLVNVKRRLQLIYPNRHELVTRKIGETYDVDLKLLL
ncbi:MAG: Histidine kinase [Chitinophagaceae bacterium]|nr:Histidine kinase [Chitinophagaceae bacterium]